MIHVAGSSERLEIYTHYCKKITSSSRPLDEVEQEMLEGCYRYLYPIPPDPYSTFNLTLFVVLVTIVVMAVSAILRSSKGI